MDLPETILLEILSKLPPKTLSVCRCVCKTFKDLASPSLCFGSLYSRRATQSLVLQIRNKEYKLTPYLHMFDSEADLACGLDFSTKFRFDIPRVSDPFTLTLKNSCNGLLYLVGRFKDDLNSIIFNPLTDEYVNLPRGNIARRDQFQLLGFGAASNRYKVMRIFRTSVNEPYGVQVHEVGSGLWRDVETGPYLGPKGQFSPISNSATYLNGVAYMTWCSQESSMLVFFDFEKEEFGEIALPNLSYSKGCIAISGVLRDCLCVCYNVYQGLCSWERVDLWVMRNGGGDGELWSRKFSIGRTVGPIFGRHIDNARALQLLSNGKILLFSGSHDLFSYDPNNNSLIYVGHELEHVEPLLEPINLTPSFVPLKDQLAIDQAMVRRVK